MAGTIPVLLENRFDDQLNSSSNVPEQEQQGEPETEVLVEESPVEEAPAPVQTDLHTFHDPPGSVLDEPVVEPSKKTYASILRVAKDQYASSVATQPSRTSAPAVSDWNHIPAPVNQQQGSYASSYVPESGHSSYIPDSGVEATEESFSFEEGEVKSIYVRNLPSTVTADEIEQELLNCSKIKPDGVFTRNCQMSLETDSPLHSSSSDDLVAFLDAELKANSSGSLSSEDEDEEVDDVDEHEGKRVKRCKVEISENILEQGSTSKETYLKIEGCTHPGSFGDMCIICGQRVEEESGVTFGYIHKGLRLANDEIVRLRNTDMKSLLRQRKLYLVLDLDHTLLNSTLLAHLTVEEEYLKCQADSLQDVSKGSLFMLEFMHMMTKLRPFVRTFLKEASEMFEMYIYTMGDRPYALEMARLLDPKTQYFNAKIISRDDGTQRHQKGLDVVLGQDSAVLILDDTESAWAKHKDNLILMERYHFFASSCRQFGYHCKSLSELKNDESELEGALASVLKVLKQVHSMFFDELEGDLEGRDVRLVLTAVRKKVLNGCKIVFSRVFPTRFQADNHHLWKMAEQLGATCMTELDPSITHVVSTDIGTEKSRWAMKEKKFLVHPRWLEAANFLWQKLPEENFPVKSTKED